MWESDWFDLCQSARNLVAKVKQHSQRRLFSCSGHTVHLLIVPARIVTYALYGRSGWAVLRHCVSLSQFGKRQLAQVPLPAKWNNHQGATWCRSPGRKRIRRLLLATHSTTSIAARKWNFRPLSMTVTRTAISVVSGSSPRADPTESAGSPCPLPCSALLRRITVWYQCWKRSTSEAKAASDGLKVPQNRQRLWLSWCVMSCRSISKPITSCSIVGLPFPPRSCLCSSVECKSSAYWRRCITLIHLCYIGFCIKNRKSK